MVSTRGNVLLPNQQSVARPTASRSGHGPLVFVGSCSCTRVAASLSQDSFPCVAYGQLSSGEKSLVKSVYITKITTLNLTIMSYLENTQPSALVKNANFPIPPKSTLPVRDFFGSGHRYSEAEQIFSMHHTLTPSV